MVRLGNELNSINYIRYLDKLKYEKIERLKKLNYKVISRSYHFYQKINSNFNHEIQNKITMYGPHKDDISIKINDKELIFSKFIYLQV